MVYMVVGVAFIIAAGFDIGYQVIWVNDTGTFQIMLLMSIVVLIVVIMSKSLELKVFCFDYICE